MRTTHALAIVTLVCLAAAGCPRSSPQGEDPYDVRGLSHDDAAAQIVEAMCEYTTECGAVSFECMSDGEGTRCSYEVVPMTDAQCAAEMGEMQEEIVESLECVELDAADEAMINECLNGLARTDCPTEAELEAVVEAVERGDEPDPFGPPACEALATIFMGCADSYPSPDPESSSGSGGE